MVQDLINQISGAIGDPYLTLYVISIIPIVELRGAILTMQLMGLTTIEQMMLGMLCCIAGSTTVVLPLILLTKPFLRRLRRTKWFANIAKKVELNIQNRGEEVYNEQKEQTIDEKGKRRISKDDKKFLGLFVFVAIPLPLTGAWTGSCIGSFMDFPVWKASLSVFLGNIVAGLILTTISYFLPGQYADVFLYGFVILAIAIAIVLYFARTKSMEQKRNDEVAKYSNKSEYELAILKKEADETGRVLVKKEYIDENGDKHIVIGSDEHRNKSMVDDNDLI